MFSMSSFVSHSSRVLVLFYVLQVMFVSASKAADIDGLLFSHGKTGNTDGNRRWRDTNLDSEGKRRVVLKLKTLIKNVRSINRSLKKEIERLRVERAPVKVPHEKRYVTRSQNHSTMGPTTKTTSSNEQSTALVTLQKLSLKVSSKSTELKVPLAHTSKAPPRGLADVKQTTKALGKGSFSPTTKSRPSNYENCQFMTDKDCNRSGPCLWCSSARKCIEKGEYVKSCLAPSMGKGTDNHVVCFNIASCHSCVKLPHCVWCDSAEKCLSYRPVQELDVDCPSNKWYWRSCPYQPTVFLIMLPILMTICLLILIAICIKYYRSHKKPAKLFQHEDHNFAWNVFKKNKSRGTGESESFLSDKKKSKIQIRDCREKRPESFSPGDRLRKTGRLSPHVLEEGKRRAASFGPSSTGSPKRDRVYLGF